MGKSERTRLADCRLHDAGHRWAGVHFALSRDTAMRIGTRLNDHGKRPEAVALQGTRFRG